MIGTLIGATVVGGLIYNRVKDYKEKKEREKNEQLNQRLFELRQRMRIEESLLQPKVVKKTVVKAVSNKKMERQVKFFDIYRALDAKLARNVREGSGGITYLINGLTVTKRENDLMHKLKRIRNYRNNLAHNKEQWKHIDEPNYSMMQDLYDVQNWVAKNYYALSGLVYKGKQALANKTSNRYNRY